MRAAKPDNVAEQELEDTGICHPTERIRRPDGHGSGPGRGPSRAAAGW
jgi:hypothetical protein